MIRAAIIALALDGFDAAEHARHLRLDPTIVSVATPLASPEPRPASRPLAGPATQPPAESSTAGDAPSEPDTPTPGSEGGGQHGVSDGGLEVGPAEIPADLPDVPGATPVVVEHGIEWRTPDLPGPVGGSYELDEVTVWVHPDSSTQIGTDIDIVDYDHLAADGWAPIVIDRSDPDTPVPGLVPLPDGDPFDIEVNGEAG
ncbi:MAG: hypothetical protein AAGA17_00320 [Actinomycetota bacterium]